MAMDLGVMAGRGSGSRAPRSAMLDHMLQMAGMVDDDAMMELAIQLSLQEQVTSQYCIWNSESIMCYRTVCMFIGRWR